MTVELLEETAKGMSSFGIVQEMVHRFAWTQGAQSLQGEQGPVTVADRFQGPWNRTELLSQMSYPGEEFHSGQRPAAAFPGQQNS